MLEVLPILKIIFKDYQAHIFLGILCLLWMHLKTEKKLEVFQMKVAGELLNSRTIAKNTDRACCKNEVKIEDLQKEVDELRNEVAPLISIFGRIIIPKLND